MSCFFPANSMAKNNAFQSLVVHSVQNSISNPRMSLEILKATPPSNPPLISLSCLTANQSERNKHILDVMKKLKLKVKKNSPWKFQCKAPCTIKGYRGFCALDISKPYYQFQIDFLPSRRPSSPIYQSTVQINSL